MSATPTVSGIQEEELNFMRYFLALKIGRNAMARVFEWSYEGGYPIKDYLLSQPGYSNRKFKNDFNQDQRRKLASSSPADVRSFDVSLLFMLLQLACGLARVSDPVWRIHGPSLENLLYRLKQLRNAVAHAEHMLTQLSLDNKLSELQQLIEDMYQSAALRFGKSSLLVTHLCTEVCQQFVSMKLKIRETLKPADLAEMKQLQQEIQHFGEEMKVKVKVMGVKELSDQYQSLFMIVPAPGFSPDVKFKPSLAFTKLQIQEDKVVCSRPSQIKQVRDVKCDELLQVTRRDGTRPDVIILTGEGGSGKTTLFKYLMERWVSDPDAVYGLDQVDLMLYIQCRESGVRSFDQLLHQLLYKTIQASGANLEFFRDTILRLKTIILIDGYDEVNEDSEILVKDILQVTGRVRVLVSTRPGSADQLTCFIPSSTRSLDLLVKGITSDLHSQYCSKMIDIMVDEVDKRSNIKESVNAKLQDLQVTLGTHLNNPLTLTLVTLLWVERPEKFNAFTTITEVYDEISVLLTGKLLEKLRGKIINAEGKCKQFLTLHDDIALQSLKKREFDLSQASVRALKEHCNSLGLPHGPVLSNYFTGKRSRRGLRLIWIWSYLHRGFQEHGAGRALMKRLSAVCLTGHTSQQLGAPDSKTNVLKQIMSTNVLKQIMSDGAQEEWYLYVEVLYRLTGLLAARNDQHLTRYIPEILELMPLAISYNGSVQIEKHLLLVLESKINQVVIQNVAQKLSDIRIWSCIGYYLRALPPILSVTQPDEIKMEILQDPEIYPDLRDALLVIAKTTVTVTLQLVQHYAANTGVSDVYLQSLRSTTCTLTEFTGRLSSVSLLPHTLQWLWLRCTKYDLPALASALPHLSLKQLDLCVEVIGQPSADTFPVLPFYGDLLVVTLDAMVTDEQAGWCCEVVRRLCPRDREHGYESLFFNNNHFTSTGVERLLQGLLQQDLVREVGVHVSSSYNFTKKESDALTNLLEDHDRSYLQLLEGSQ